MSAGYVLDTIKKAEIHMAERHPSTDLIIACNKCNKEYPGLRPVACHYPKCKRKPTDCPKITNRVLCPECPPSFANNSGLGHHLRRAQPEALCRQREEAAEARETLILTGGAFTPEEVLLMLRLEAALKGEKLMAKAMHVYLPLKSVSQIRNKRCEPVYKRRRAKYMSNDAKDKEEEVLPTGSSSAEPTDTAGGESQLEGRDPHAPKSPKVTPVTETYETGDSPPSWLTSDSNDVCVLNKAFIEDDEAWTPDKEGGATNAAYDYPPPGNAAEAPSWQPPPEISERTAIGESTDSYENSQDERETHTLPTE